MIRLSRDKLCSILARAGQANAWRFLYVTGIYGHGSARIWGKAGNSCQHCTVTLAHEHAMMKLPTSFALFVLLGVLGLLAMAPEVQGQANPFDADYVNCPSRLRLPSITGVAIRHPVVEGDLRTDQLEVSWNNPGAGYWQTLGDRVYSAQITVIVDGPGAPLTQHAPLGAEAVIFEDTALASEWETWVTVTDQQYIISDIAHPGAQ